MRTCTYWCVCVYSFLDTMGAHATCRCRADVICGVRFWCLRRAACNTVCIWSHRHPWSCVTGRCVVCVRAPYALLQSCVVCTCVCVVGVQTLECATYNAHVCVCVCAHVHWNTHAHAEQRRMFAHPREHRYLCIYIYIIICIHDIHITTTIQNTCKHEMYTITCILRHAYTRCTQSHTY